MAEFTFSQDWDNDGMMSYQNAKTLLRYRELCEERSKVDMKQFDCFFAFNNEQFEQGLKSIRPLKEGEKLVRLYGGGFATKDGAERLAEYYRSIEEKIKQECDPQEVYCYEYNNYESCIAYDGDANAIRLIIDYWGEEVARKIVRKSAFYSIDGLLSKSEN